MRCEAAFWGMTNALFKNGALRRRALLTAVAMHVLRPNVERAASFATCGDAGGLRGVADKLAGGPTRE
jgi:hypothetical protein